MCSPRHSSIMFLLVLFNINSYIDSQLIGEEKKYVFLEQALLERVRSTLLEMTEALEARMGRLEDELSSVKDMIPINPPPEMTEALEARMGRLEDELSSVKNMTPIIPPLEMTEALEARMGRLEEELSSVKNMTPIIPPLEPLMACPALDVGIECPQFVMDPATLYSRRFLSRDKLTLSNRRLDSTYDWPLVTDRKYQGVQGSSVITNQQIMYFETDIYYRIEQELVANNLVFEVGFGTENAIGNMYCVGWRGWSIHAAHNETQKKVTLSCQAKNGFPLYLKALSDATPDAEKYLKLGFLINRVDRTISVFDIYMYRKLHTFTNVEESQDLWPVFGVYSPTRQLVRIRLNSEREIASVPCGLF